MALPSPGSPARSGGLSPLGVLVLTAAVVWHVLMILRPGPEVGRANAAFSTHYFAAIVAREGGDPYDPGAVESLAAVHDTTRLSPLAGPPPLLLLTSALSVLGKPLASGAWWVMNEAALIGTVLLLLRAWRTFAPPRDFAPLLAVVSAVTYAVTLTASQGQAHFLAIGLLVAASTDRNDLRAGIWTGLALGISLATLLFVALHVSHGRWRLLGATVGTWLLVSLLALPIVAPLHQISYYTESFAQLASAPTTFGDPSIVHLWRRIFPGSGGQLSVLARAATGLSAFFLLTSVFAAFRNLPADTVQRAGQTAALLSISVLVGARSDETHLTWAVPALALVAVAIGQGWLGSRWVLPVAASAAVLVYEQPPIEAFATRLVTDQRPFLFLCVEELKLAALGVLVLATMSLGGGGRDPTRPPPPTALQ